jgi:hypothetical protein
MFFKGDVYPILIVQQSQNLFLRYYYDTKQIKHSGWGNNNILKCCRCKIYCKFACIIKTFLSY